MTTTTKDRPGVLAPPPLIDLATVLIGLGADAWHPLPFWGTVPPRLWHAVGAAAIAVSLALFVAALRELHRHRTSVNPYRASSAVVSTGVYARTRNPIYVSMLLLVLSIGVLANTLWIPLLVPLLWLTLDRGVVRREERYLARKFGSDYEAYRRRVRRWL